MAALIDRTKIVNVAYEGTVPSETMFVQYGSMAPYIDAVKAAGHGLPAKADVAAGQALIEAAGYAKGGDGIYEKDGQPLSVSIHVNSASTEYTRTIDVVVEQLQRAGIDAKAVPVENGVFWGEVLPLGNYEMSYSWLSCGSVNEPWSSMNRYTNNAMAPISERAPGNNTQRWDTEATAAYTAIVNKMGDMALGDRRPRRWSRKPMAIWTRRCLHPARPQSCCPTTPPTGRAGPRRVTTTIRRSGGPPTDHP